MDASVARGKRLGRGSTAEIWAVAACLALMFTGSTIPTPLYTGYQHLFGFGELTLTLIYAVYVVGNLAALLFAGRLSDQVGRRPVTYTAIAIAATSTVVYLFAHGVAWLAAARMLSGLALGLASGTTTAWLAELHTGQSKARATAMAVGGNMAGLGIGALMAGLLAQFAPWPLHLSFVVYLGVLLALAVLMSWPAETVTERVVQFERLSLRPRLGVPRGIRAEFFADRKSVV